MLLSLWLLALPLAAQGELGLEQRGGLAPEKALRDLVITYWSADDGLPASALTNALQTKDGYFWIASFEGLIRFDGREFTVFDRRSTPALAISGFHELMEDDAGNLWIGTQGSGVAVYRDGRFELLPAVREPRTTVWTIVIADTGDMWIGTGDFGAFRYRDGQWSAAGHPALADVTVRDVIQDRRGAIWFATEGNGVVRLAGGTYSRYTVESGLASDAATSLREAADGTIWVGTERGLSKIDGDAVVSLPALAGIEIYRLYQDDYENLWIAAEQGLIRRNAVTGEIEHVDSLGGESLRSLSAVVFGREGAIWLSSYRDGFYRLKQGKFKNYTAETGLSTERVTGVYETPGGDVLIGGDGGRIDVVRGDAVSEFDPGETLPDVRVRSILRDRRGTLWVGSYAGLLKVSDGARQWYTTDNGLPSNQVRILHEDRAGRLWIGTRNAGLLALAGDGGFRVIDKSYGLSSDFVFSIDEGPGGRLMIGTYEGLSILGRDGSIATYGPAEGMPGGVVFSTFTDSAGVVWIATNGGLARLHRGEIRRLTTSEGLPAETVFDYREDGFGSVWLSSSMGVIQVAKEQLVAVMEGERPTIEAKVYDERDGMARRDCTGAAKILQASDGRLWFPTLGGVAVVDPDDVPVNRVAPPVVISRFAVDGEAVELHAAGDEEMVIGPGKKAYAFSFAALSFLEPSKVRVRYRLVGFDDDWTEARDERSVRYTNLPRGDYSFRVIAANDDGLWNEEGATLRFRVRPLFYQNPLFIVASALLAAAGVRGVYRWRMKTVRARNAFLEELVAKQRQTERERQRVIEELELKNAELERFNYTVSHDLKTPLVTIKGFLGFLEKDAAAGNVEQMGDDIRRISAAADTLSRLLEELLELSRIGRIANPPEEVALGKIARKAQDLVAGAIAERGVTVSIAPDLPSVLGDRARLVEVVQNLLENAVKHMGDQEEPRIEIGSRTAGTPDRPGVGDGEELVFFVRDNGVGIEPRYHEKIFRLFERLDANTDGTGVGLALVKRIVEVHGGRIWVESDGRGRGSRFCFTLPRRAPEVEAS